MNERRAFRAQNVNEDLRWFKAQLDRHLTEVRAAKRGYRFRTFMDTSDVRRAVMGMYAYSPLETFSKEHFLSKRATVICLAAGGWLGQFGLLLPHQAEFLRLLEFNFGVGRIGNGLEDPVPFASHFLFHVITAQASHADLRPLEEMLPEERLDAVLEYSKSAESFFKAAQCIQGTWQTRLHDLSTGGFLVIDEQSLDYTALLDTSEFRRFHRSFQDRRKRARSDFVDALAMTLLVEKARAVRRTKEIPCFYASTKYPIHAANDAGLPLECRVDDGEPLNVLHDEDYFLFKAMFAPPDNVAHAYYGDLQDLEDLQKRLEERLTKAPAALRPEDVDDLTLAEKPLLDVIQEIRSFSFMENIWLPFSKTRLVKQSIEKLSSVERYTKDREFSSQVGAFVEAVERSETEAFRIAVDESEEQIRRQLEANRVETNRVWDLWMRMEADFPDIRDQLSDDPRDDPQLLRHVQLIQFSLPEEARPSIRDVLERLLEVKTNPEEFDDARRDLIRRYYRALKSDTSDADRTINLAIASSILWLVDSLDDHLIHLLRNTDRSAHWVFDLILIAACYRSKCEIAEGDAILAKWDAVTADPSIPSDDRARLALRMAFVFFRRWNLTDSDTKSDTDPQEHARWLKEAIRYAKCAVDLYPTLHLDRAYAINNYLYYMCNDSSCHSIREMREAAGMLLDEFALIGQGRRSRDRWAYQYEDTLAHYYECEALHSRNDGDELSYEHNLVEAFFHIQEAHRLAPKDRGVSNYRTRLQVKCIEAGVLDRLKAR